MSISRAVWFLTYPIILYILILIIIESLFKNEKEKSIDRSVIKRIFVLNRLVPHRKFAFFLDILSTTNTNKYILIRINELLASV